MDKLEVGKWYRILDSGFDEYLFQYKNDSEFTSMFDKWLDGVYRGESYHPKDWHGIKPLETLTPSEALILLGNGFELINKRTGLITWLKGNRLHWRENCENYGDIHWEEDRDCLELEKFTIYALPESENG